MLQPLLSTKLNPPTNTPFVINRSRLKVQLNAHLAINDEFQRRLTLVSAPAGYGKTTLIVEWLNTLNFPNTWLSLDSRDNDPIRFFTYLVAALQQIDTIMGDRVGKLLQSGRPPPPEELINQLIPDIEAQPSPFIIALDDYHEIVNPTIHQATAFLLDHQPQQMHLVILTREDPPFPLARLRACEQIIGIRQEELRFTTDEVAQYLRERLDIELPEEDVLVLQNRIEGWPVGLQLTSLLLQGQTDIHNLLTSLTGTSRYVMDYLIEEVLDQQSAEVQDFLLQTSILDRFCALLCNAVTGSDNGQPMLALIEQSNLFLTPLDHTREWYRYHRLFADLLRHQIRVREPDLVESLYMRASAWFEAQQMLDEAIDYALVAENWEQAERLILKVDEAMLKRGEIASLLNWYKQFPNNYIETSPDLCLAAAWPFLLNGQLDIAETYIQNAIRLTGDEPEYQVQIRPAQAYLAWLRGNTQEAIGLSTEVLSYGESIDAGLKGQLSLNLVLAYWHQGRMRETENALQTALQAAKLVDNKYLLFTAWIFQARVFAVRAQLQQAKQVTDGIVETGARLPVMSLVHLDLGTIHYEWNDLETAAYHFERSLALSQKTGNEEFLAASYMALVRLRLSLGDLSGAESAAWSAHMLTEKHTLSPQMVARIKACLAQVALAQSDLQNAAVRINEMTLGADPHPFYRYLNLMPGLLALAHGDKHSATLHLAEQYDLASQSEWYYGMVIVRVYQALAAERTNRGYAFLVEALDVAQPEHMLRSFIDAGEELVPLLRQAAQEGIHPVFVGQILAGLQVYQSEPASDELFDPLSEREYEVLSLLIAGLTNPEIAVQLVVSVGTVKTHVHNIYSKLDVRNRAEAISRAAKLKLL